MSTSMSAGWSITIPELRLTWEDNNRLNRQMADRMPERYTYVRGMFARDWYKSSDWVNTLGDADRDGKVTRDEFKTFLEQRIDANRNGEISIKEYTAVLGQFSDTYNSSSGMAYGFRSPKGSDNYTLSYDQLFNAFDKDQSNTLTVTDFHGTDPTWGQRGWLTKADMNNLIGQPLFAYRPPSAAPAPKPVPAPVQAPTEPEIPPMTSKNNILGTKTSHSWFKISDLMKLLDKDNNGEVSAHELARLGDNARDIASSLNQMTDTYNRSNTQGLNVTVDERYSDFIIAGHQLHVQLDRNGDGKATKDDFKGSDQTWGNNWLTKNDVSSLLSRLSFLKPFPPHSRLPAA